MLSFSLPLSPSRTYFSSSVSVDRPPYCRMPHPWSSFSTEQVHSPSSPSSLILHNHPQPSQPSTISQHFSARPQTHPRAHHHHHLSVSPRDRYHHHSHRARYLLQPFSFASCPSSS